VLALYDRLSRTNDQVMAALDADAPGPELMGFLEDHRTAMDELTKIETDNPADSMNVEARLEGAQRLKAQITAVQTKLEQKSRDLVRQREKSLRTRQMLDAYTQKK
jgi:hypothetical protein